MSLAKNQVTDRPIKEVIEEAARVASEKVRDRNRRMGWPLITNEFLRKEAAQKSPQNRTAEK
ncbi:hypothetical protein [Roseibacillus persicicus]|uniref:hypothetical protein n=1 Tax=Roseibacillus persicicus TaxID=454148 RepID=UPI00280CCF5B|nr:hypothetical protein [Roseibacillus persicicus]MDQ8192050.1 hypothetical protein [Roseibacillus persicicus]